MSSRPVLRTLLPLVVAVVPLLAGCDLLGIEPASALAERREADGKAVGAACRHAGRALEDCFALNRKAEKAAVYAGWKEMSDYMRENKVPEAVPQVGADRPAAREGEEASARAGTKR
ncbi:MAG: hypothetical protein RI988_2249 [Pseudomonadota bacterium]|jgi:hypothetical protein